MKAIQIVGRYAIYGKIAQGGMASVHLGRLMGTAHFSRTVAIKRLHPHLTEESEFLATLLDEASLAARIHHPNVVATLDLVNAENELLVVMEYVRGESLSRLVHAESARGRRAPLPIVSAVVVGALHGLQAAHEAMSDHGAPLGIVHRDVSPQNILVGADGVARLIDFGVAKAVGRIQTTDEGVIKGKVAYMAPEQLGLSGQATHRSDVYSMAVVLWEVLTGKRLFHDDDLATRLGRVLAGAKEPPSRYAPGLPAELDALVMRGLAKDPARRFDSAREMADLLTQVVPPAFPPDVAAWVEDVARDKLAETDALLAKIEDDPGIAVPAPLPQAADDPPTSVLRPPSPSAATPDPRQANGSWSRRKRLAGALAIAVLVGAGAVGLAGRSRGAASTPANVGASAPEVDTRLSTMDSQAFGTQVSAGELGSPGPQPSASSPPSKSSTAVAVTAPRRARPARPLPSPSASRPMGRPVDPLAP
jgi:serine/threonine protein kinase